MMNDLSNVFLVNEESEKTVLSSIFFRPEILGECILKVEHFYEPKHRELFRAMRKLEAKNLPIEPGSIAEVVGGFDNLGIMGGLMYIVELVDSAFTSMNFDYHQKLLIEYHTKRKIVGMESILQSVHTKPSTEVLADIDRYLTQLDETNVSEGKGLKHIQPVLERTYAWMETNHGAIAGAETGFKELDEITSGLQRTDLVVIAARPSVGKTAFALNLCKNTASKGNVTALFSIEMKDEALALRLISNSGNIAGDKMRNPVAKFGDEEWAKTTGAFAELGELPIFLDDTGTPDIPHIRRECKKLKKEFPDEHIVVMIDYMQLIKPDPKDKGNRTNEISGISRGLKAIAKELDLTVVALSQLSRGVEQRQDKRPMMSDLRESGAIEQDSDVIGLLYRDDYYNKESAEKGVIEINIAKQRNGPTGIVKLLYVKEYSKFLDIPLPTQ